jgi:rhodanese-related sulfurtransferase
VRGDPYYSEGHIPGAISMTQEEMATRMGELDKNAWIITYCT